MKINIRLFEQQLDFRKSNGLKKITTTITKSFSPKQIRVG
uniref:Uncharacterized protein n=1 Tax=Arundo donax TaxID=35708 RepID=A0A0A9Q8S2_ARUDO